MSVDNTVSNEKSTPFSSNAFRNDSQCLAASMFDRPYSALISSALTYVPKTGSFRVTVVLPDPLGPANARTMGLRLSTDVFPRPVGRF